jgi:carbamate kinase
MNGTPLFDNTPQPAAPVTIPDPMEVRQEKIDAAFKNADEAWRTEYQKYVLQVANANEEFTAEDCQLGYKKMYAMPQPREWRASGGIFQKLLREGKIRRIGTGWSKLRGVPVPKFTRG